MPRLSSREAASGGAGASVLPTGRIAQRNPEALRLPGEGRRGAMGTGRSTNAVAPGTVPAARVDGPGTDEDGGRRSSGPPCDRPTLVTVRSTNACSESAGLSLAPQPNGSGRHDKQPSNGVARPQQTDHDDHDRRRIQKSQDDHAERILRRTHRSQRCARRAAEAPSRPLATDAEEQARGIVGQCSSEANAALSRAAKVQLLGRPRPCDRRPRRDRRLNALRSSAFSGTEECSLCRFYVKKLMERGFCWAGWGGCSRRQTRRAR
jgi:hypothetical protein